MKSFVGKVFHISAILLQMVNGVGLLVPDEYKPYLAIFISLVQGVVGTLQHYFTPDGDFISGNK